MVLKDNLYRIVEQKIIDGKQSFIIVLNSSCPIYEAHFPNMPITPGVCIIQIVEELLEVVIGNSLNLCSIKNAKFLSAMKPESQKVVVVFSSVKEEGNIIKSQVVITDLNNNVYAKISLQSIIA